MHRRRATMQQLFMTQDVFYLMILVFILYDMTD